jgi:hypothetical protein
LRDKIKLNFSDQCLFSRPTPDSAPQVVYINFSNVNKVPSSELLPKSQEWILWPSFKIINWILQTSSSYQDFRRLDIPVATDVQNDISSHETLNQIGLLFCCRMPHNTVAQSTANSLFTAKISQCTFVACKSSGKGWSKSIREILWASSLATQRCAGPRQKGENFFVRAHCLSVGRSWILLTEQRGIAHRQSVSATRVTLSWWKIRCVPWQIHFVGFVVWALAPLFVWFAVFLDETQIWLGDLQVVLVVCLWCCLICLYLWTFCVLYKCSFDSLCSCKDRATVRYRPNSRKKRWWWPLLLILLGKLQQTWML